MAKVAATTFFVGKVIQSSFEQATPADSIYFWGHFSFFKHMASYSEIGLPTEYNPSTECTMYNYVPGMQGIHD